MTEKREGDAGLVSIAFDCYRKGLGKIVVR